MLLLQAITALIRVLEWKTVTVLHYGVDDIGSLKSHFKRTLGLIFEIETSDELDQSFWFIKKCMKKLNLLSPDSW